MTAQRDDTLRDTLLATGVACVAGMLFFYRRKQTLPFKVCYGLAWPTVGGGIMLAVTPSPEEMSKRLEHSRAVTADDLRRQREANAATIEAMGARYRK